MLRDNPVEYDASAFSRNNQIGSAIVGEKISDRSEVDQALDELEAAIRNMQEEALSLTSQLSHVQAKNDQTPQSGAKPIGRPAFDSDLGRVLQRYRDSVDETAAGLRQHRMLLRI